MMNLRLRGDVSGVSGVAVIKMHWRHVWDFQRINEMTHLKENSMALFRIHLFQTVLPRDRLAVIWSHTLPYTEGKK